MDLFVVPTIGFKLLYAFVIVRLSRRDLVWINVTTNPNAEWIARQITAFPGTRLRATRRATIPRAGAGIAATFQRASMGRTKIWPG